MGQAALIQALVHLIRAWVAWFGLEGVVLFYGFGFVSHRKHFTFFCSFCV